jgi:hypothetical protein
MRLYPIATAIALALAPTVALAQDAATTGAVGGAVTGAIVGGPVGAVVGGVAGGAIGASVEPDVRTYVVSKNVPSVRVDEEIAVGEVLPSTVVLRPVPKHNKYRFAVVNHQKVIVEPKTRKIVEIVE